MATGKIKRKTVKRAKKKRLPEGKALALFCAGAVMDKKAEEPVVLDIRGLSSVTDYFVICHGLSGRQVQAIAENVKERAHKAGVRLLGEEGFTEARWVLLDFGDVVVHVFQEEVRKFYNLERLWIHGSEVEIPEEKHALS